MIQVKVKKLYPDAKMPIRATSGSAGWDVYAYVEGQQKDVGQFIRPGERIAVSVGVSVEIPPGYEIQFRGRSGLAFKSGIVSYNGTIDSDYRGEMKALLFNNSFQNFVFRHGDRVGQLIVNKLPEVEFVEVEELSETDRGNGGFGSSGR